MVTYEKGTDMKKVIQITLLLLLATGVASAAEAKSATILLQEGIYAEETEGNLDKAIGIYKEAATAAEVSEKAAAEATYRTGLCYLKKGDKTAAAAQFRAVVAKYPNQKELVAQAQKQIDAIQPAMTFQLPEDVMKYLGQLHADTYAQARKLGIAPNSIIYAIDGKLDLITGGLVTYKNETGARITGEMNNGITSYPDYDYYNEDGKKLKTRFVRSKAESGTYDVYVTPDRPIEVNEVRHGSWIGRTAKTLSRDISGNYSLTMQNQLNVEGLEDFLMVVPKDTKIVKKSAEPISVKTVGDYDVYQWQKHVYKTTNNKVTVQFASPQGAESEKPLQLQPAPWTDGEVAKLTLKTKTGMNIGELLYIPRLIQQGGKQIWQLDSYQIVPISNSVQFTRVEADATTMAPSAGRTINQLGDFVAAYEPDKVTLSMTAKGKTTTKDIAISGPVFDNEEALMLIRRLPLAEGYSTRFQIFPVISGTVVDCQIDVVGTEDITVPAGSSKCWMVKLAVYSGITKALEHTLWFSADEKKQLMKYDAGTAIMELEKTTTIPAEAAIADEKTGVSMTLPNGWFGYHADNGGYATMWMFVNEGLETWSSFQAKAPGGAGEDLSKAVDGDIEVLKGFFKNYVPRAGSRVNLTIAGIPAIKYTADYTEDDKAMVEYRTYAMDKSMVYWFVFRTEKDLFDGKKAAYDAMVSSFAISGK